MLRWLKKMCGSPLATPCRFAIDDFVQRHATRQRVLDLGAGLSPYARYFPNRIAVDLAPCSGVHVCGDAHSLPFRSSTFDVVLCTEVLEHVREPRTVEREIARVVKPGGKLILTTRFNYPIHMAPHDYYRFTKHGLEYLFRHWCIESLEGDSSAFDSAGMFVGVHLRERHGVFEAPFRFLWRVVWHMYRLLVRTSVHSRRSTLSEAAPSGYLMVARRCG